MILIALAGALCGVPFGPGTALGGKEPNALNPYVDPFFCLLVTL